MRRPIVPCVSCDCCDREERDPQGWLAMRYYEAQSFNSNFMVPHVQIEQVLKFEPEMNPDMRKEFLCSVNCVCKRLRSILKAKQKARLKEIAAAAPAMRQIAAPKASKRKPAVLQ